MRPSPLFLFAGLGILVAGCLGKGPTLDPKGDALASIDFEWAERALPFGEGHDHFNRTQHQGLSTANFETRGWNPLSTDHYGKPTGGNLCGDATQAGDRRYAVVHGFGSDVAFILVDVTNATNPQVVGELALPWTGARDVAITPDARYVVAGTAGAVRQPEKLPLASATPGPTWNSPCNKGPVPVPARTQDYVPTPNGLVLVNVQNPRNPIIESYAPLPATGAHSVYATTVNGRTYALASVVNLVAAVTYFELFEIVPTPRGAALVSLSVITEQALEGGAPLLNGHNDGVIQVHPITGRTYAYLAHWHQGMLIVDITEPRLPKIVGRWSDNPGPHTNVASNDFGDIHEAIPLEGTWDGRHYTFIGQEIVGHPTARPSGYVKVLDTTDPTAPHEVAHWNLPVDVDWEGRSLIFSTHYLTRVDRTLFVSHYHAGVWAIDLTNVSTNPTLPAVGVFVPANDPPTPPPRRSYQWAPTVMEVEALPDGDLVVFDSGSGVYLVRFNPTYPIPPRIWEG